jgi:hypothetical protein
MKIKGSEIQNQLKKELEFCPGRWQNLLDKEYVAVDDILEELDSCFNEDSYNGEHTKLLELYQKLKEVKQNNERKT